MPLKPFSSSFNNWRSSLRYCYSERLLRLFKVTSYNLQCVSLVLLQIYKSCNVLIRCLPLISPLYLFRSLIFMLNEQLSISYFGYHVTPIYLEFINLHIAFSHKITFKRFFQARKILLMIFSHSPLLYRIIQFLME